MWLIEGNLNLWNKILVIQEINKLPNTIIKLLNNYLIKTLGIE